MFVTHVKTRNWRNFKEVDADLQERQFVVGPEEPELSLNAGIVSQLAPLIYRMQRVRKRQVIVTTHSEALLSDPGIDGREVIELRPSTEGTDAEVVSDVAEVRDLLVSGLAVGEVVLPRTRPSRAMDLSSLN